MFIPPCRARLSRRLPSMSRSRFCSCVLCAVIAALAAWLLLGAVPTARAQAPKSVSFINDVAPILKENCFACHDAKKRSGKFDMTSFEKLLGGEDVEHIVAGKPAESELYDRLTDTGDKRMHPKKDNL